MLTLLPVRDEKTLALQKSYMVWCSSATAAVPTFAWICASR